ncbi:ABC-type branched-chain amino acid transport system ATPase component [Zalerion maritima]|uniref:ABC-type branched-chain amino acid transport system ATPase component n=1 Tax=Zalerion maritima TaxID=339359 RepID=A0AAD5RN74_9PEZI|nr:ABC-type branched-chain amino acid transport system ATPase component [Zalerion maritima]
MAAESAMAGHRLVPSASSAADQHMVASKRESAATDVESIMTKQQEETESHARISMSGANHISLDDVEEVGVEIRGLKVTVDTNPSIMEPSTYGDLMKQVTGGSKGKKGQTSIDDGLGADGAGAETSSYKKTLLHSISASIKPGTLTAIIGGSGSGKTTLLNTLSERVSSSKLEQTGRITFNGAEGVGSCRYAYVMQQDILLPSLTVRETLGYAADLRLPPPCTEEDRRRVVQDVIMELGLKECAETRIGDQLHKGASGGEKRRTSIGVQLLSNPSVLFLDEPTTGLDATSAFQLVRTLKSLSSKGRTVVTTIHQPRSEIWGLFDNLIVLSRGSPVYIGPKEGCAPWIESLGLKIGEFVNPAEWIIDCAAVDTRTPELEADSSARVSRLKEVWLGESDRLYGPGDNGDVSEAIIPGNSTLKKHHVLHAPFLRQLRVLTSRTLKVTYRDPMGMSSSILEAILMGIITGYIFYNLPETLSGIRSRQGALYTAAGLQGYLFLVFEVYRLTFDVPVFDREYSEGCVSPLPFILSRRIARLLTEDFPVPFLYSVIFYFMAGFERTAEQFFLFFAINLLNHYIAVTCALTCVTAARGFPGASLYANLTYTLQSVACGYFIQINSIPVYLRWLKWLTWTFYVFSALCTNEFGDSFYACPAEPSSPDNPACIEYTGAFILNALGFPSNWLWKPIVVMVAFIVFFVSLSFIGLTHLKVQLGIARAKTSADETDLSAGKEKMAEGTEKVRQIDMEIQDFAILLEKRLGLKRSMEKKQILSPTTAMFRAAELNVIMGPSGSGKTSLLNAVAGRLVNRPGTTYKRSGTVKFNDAIPSEQVVRSVVSFVAQEDGGLLPSLTVRETLRYAALLRLPPFMSKQQQLTRAEEVLLKMGLKDCADIVIGNELVKGISGGEKRRVSIAIQILTDPRILLLDEPTSGLDAFTAGSIMDVLSGLAKEGRTIILTIHQARSDLWQQFGNVLLLARGGKAVYSGKSTEMLNWFSALGCQCPRNTNPADFALDLVTVDLRREDMEEESRNKVSRLIKAWDDEVKQEMADPDRTGRGNERQKLEGIQEEDVASTQGKGEKADVAEESGLSPPARERSTSVTRKSSRIPPPRHSMGRASLSTPAELGALVRAPAPFSTALPILLARSFLNIRRQPDLILARTMQVLGFAVILTLFFAPLKDNYESIQTRVGFVQEVGAFYFIGMLQNVAVYPAERNVAYAEHIDGVYGPSLFLLVYTILELPLELLSSAVFGVMAVFAVGVEGDASSAASVAKMWGFLSLATFGIVSCGESLGIMFNTLFADHAGFAFTLSGVFLSVSQTMQGILSIDMPALLEGANWLSPLRYSPRALAPPSLVGVTFTCRDDQKVEGGVCPITTGEQVLRLYGMEGNEDVNMIPPYGAIQAIYLRRLRGSHHGRSPPYAIISLFDKRWEKHSPASRLPCGHAAGDRNVYATGAISSHNVVLVHIPSIGKIAAASAAARCQTTFPNICLELVVGICGGFPFTHDPEGEEIVLDIQDVLHRLSSRSERGDLETELVQNLEIIGPATRYYPGADKDTLFEATYNHEDMKEERPSVHFGPIVSGDSVMKSAEERDRIARDREVIGFEMKAIRIWHTSLSSLVIKGVCDYSDSHKNEGIAEICGLVCGCMR